MLNLREKKIAMPEKILSICIPTYNRSKYLIRLLNSVVHQIVDNNLPVNIKITNNASTDDTQYICDSFSLKYDFVTVVHQPENYGADFNICTAFTLSDSQYTWVIGDDDYVRDGALMRLLELINETNNPDLISLGADFSGDFVTRPLLKPLSYSVLSSPAEYAKKVGIMLTFISGMVIKRSGDFNKEKCLEQFNNSCLIQLAWVLFPLTNNGVFVCSSDHFIVAEPDNTGGYKLFDVFSIKLKFMCDSILGVTSNVTPIILRSSSRFLISLTHKRVNSNFIRELDISVIDSVFGDIPVYRYFYRYLYKYSSLWRVARVIKRLVKI